MEIQKICHKCNFYLIQNEITNKELCSDCKIVYKSQYTSSTDYDIECIELGKQSTYFHINDKILDINSNLNADQNDQEEILNLYSKKNVLLIGCGSVKRMPILESIKKLNFNILVCLCREKTWAFKYFDDWIYAEHENINDVETTLKIVENYCKNKKINFDAILTYDDYCTLIASYLANKFSLPSIPFDLVKRIKNKHQFRILSKEVGINYPNYFLISHNERKNYLNNYKYSQTQFACSNNNQIKFPVIVKNPNGAGKDFVHKCNSIKEYLSCIEESINFSDSMDLLVEEFFDGHEIDIELLIQNNEIIFLAISDNFPAFEPSFYELGGITPSIKLNDQEKTAVENLMIEWLKKLNFENACLHFEARCRPGLIKNGNIDKNFLMPIEINLRLGGAETWSMIKSSLNVNLIHEYLSICLGIHLEKTKLKEKLKHPRYQCISKDFHPAKKVFIDSIKINLKKLRQTDNVVEISIFRSAGDKLNQKDYIGWVTAKCDYNNSSNENLYSSLNEVLSCIQFKFNEC